MTLSWRTFLFEEGNTIRRLSNKAVRELMVGARTFPECAGRRLRYLSLYFDTRPGQKLLPSNLRHAEAGYLEFNETGNPQPQGALAAVKLWETGLKARIEEATQRGSVVAVTDRLAHRAMHDRIRWIPTNDEWLQVGRHLFKN